MASLVFEISDHLALRLQPYAAVLPSILEMGLRQVEGDLTECYRDADQVFEFLARLPNPKEVLALRASPELNARVSELIDLKREGQASASELHELDHYLHVDEVVRVAKAYARERLGEE